MYSKRIKTEEKSTKNSKLTQTLSTEDAKRKIKIKLCSLEDGI